MAYDQASVISVCLIFPLLGFLLTSVRLLMRWRLKMTFGIDDWLILIGSILAIGMGVNIVVGMSFLRPSSF